MPNEKKTTEDDQVPNEATNSDTVERLVMHVRNELHGIQLMYQPLLDGKIVKDDFEKRYGRDQYRKTTMTDTSKILKHIDIRIDNLIEKVNA